MEVHHASRDFVVPAEDPNFEISAVGEEDASRKEVGARSDEELPHQGALEANL